MRDDEQLLLRRGVGVHRRVGKPRLHHENRSTSRTCTRRSGATNERAERTGHPVVQAQDLAAATRRGEPASWSTTRSPASPDMSFLEMLDVVNEDLLKKGEEPIAFDSDCREGICGMCGVVHRRPAARPGAEHHDLPAAHAPVQGRRDDHHRAVARQGVSGRQGSGRRSQRASTASSSAAATSRSTPAGARGNAIPMPKDIAEAAMDSAACIGCGACVAACKNASAPLFVSAKIRTSRCCRRAT